ncbi:MAG TPA: iron ABC transporter permease [Candidatus Limnocylindria bacterium]|jgi:iron complex transport system permease protein|nr:iron ABC transporter permease [Candidatus Limnocylindria bacterium]
MRTALVLGALGGLLFASMLGAILVGAVAIAPADVWAALWGGADQTTGTIVRDLRLTRVFAAALVGGSLAVAGALLQGLLRNPLADPYVTGTSAGASLSAVGAIALGAAAVPAILPLAAFVGALAAAAVVWRLASLGGRTTVLTVLLAGIVLSSFAGGVVTLLLVASDRIALRLRAVLGWLLGGVSVTDRSELAMATAIIVVAALAAFALARRLDAFAFGDETAATLGVDVDRTTTAVLGVAALLTGAAVALAGVIGFIGLIVPHALRPLLGAPHARLVPACFLLGATTLVVADAAARVVLSPAELPVGVITGLVGGPFFLALLLRGRRRVVV